jgi:hypothetical protein
MLKIEKRKNACHPERSACRAKACYAVVAWLRKLCSKSEEWKKRNSRVILPAPMNNGETSVIS